MKYVIKIYGKDSDKLFLSLTCSERNLKNHLALINDAYGQDSVKVFVYEKDESAKSVKTFE